MTTVRSIAVLVLAACLAATACTSSRADSSASGQREAADDDVARSDGGTHYVIGVDVSASQTPTRRQEGQELVHGVVGRMNFGDRITVVETYRARSDSAGQWSDSAPRARGPRPATQHERTRLQMFRQRARMMAGSFLAVDPSRPAMTTDILATVQRAADYAHAADGRRTTLLLISDMLNATGELDMERAGGIPGAGWVAERKAQGRLPDLRGVCVVVAGADVSSRRGVAAREFWERYFRATGGDFDVVRYRTMIADARDVACR